jgi:hypothetical protein
VEHQDELITTIRWQQRGFAGLGCPFYGALASELIADVKAGGPAGELLAPFAAEPVESAYVLRLFAGLHWLVLEGEAPDLARHFPSVGGDGDARGAMTVIRSVLRDPPPGVTGYLTHPPQTNEVGRAAALASGMAFIAGQAGLPLCLREIGASAGLNLRLDSYWYEQDGVRWGNPTSPVRFTGLWQGASAPFAARPRLLDRRGCDRSPIDVTTGAGATRLLSYVWPEPAARFTRARNAIALASGLPVTIDKADAAAWLPGQLRARRAGSVLVVYHSVVWQYLGQIVQDRLRAQLAAAGASATSQTPLAWLRLEPHPDSYVPAELRLTLWNGQAGGPQHWLLATTGFHGGTLHWRAGQHS